MKLPFQHLLLLFVASCCTLLSNATPCLAQNGILTDTDSFEFNLQIGSGFSADQVRSIEIAAAMWDYVIIDPVVDATYNTPGGPDLFVGTTNIDGSGNAIASATQSFGLNSSQTFIHTLVSGIDFDSADLQFLDNTNRFLDVAFHEMGHALGIGGLWSSQGLTDPNNNYTGANGLAAYPAEFDPNATFGPIEQDFGPGSAGSHWDEGVVLSSALLPGANFDQEILSPIVSDPTENFLSTVTVRGLVDQGFTVREDFQSITITDLAAIVTVPEPNSFAFFATASVFALLKRRRRNHV